MMNLCYNEKDSHSADVNTTGVVRYITETCKYWFELWHDTEMSTHIIVSMWIFGDTLLG